MDAMNGCVGRLQPIKDRYLMGASINLFQHPAPSSYTLHPSSTTSLPSCPTCPIRHHSFFCTRFLISFSKMPHYCWTAFKIITYPPTYLPTYQPTHLLTCPPIYLTYPLKSISSISVQICKMYVCVMESIK